MNIKICDNNNLYVTIKYNWYKNKVVFSSILKPFSYCIVKIILLFTIIT